MVLGKQIKVSLPLEETSLDDIEALELEIRAVRVFYQEVDSLKRKLLGYNITIPNDLTKRVYESKKYN